MKTADLHNKRFTRWMAQLSRWGGMTLLVISVRDCSDDAHPDVSDDWAFRAFSGGDCQEAQENCPCPINNKKTACKTVPVASGTGQSCQAGTRTCADGYWGECDTDETFVGSGPLSNGLATATGCKDPCDPGCERLTGTIENADDERFLPRDESYDDPSDGDRVDSDDDLDDDEPGADSGVTLLRPAEPIIKSIAPASAPPSKRRVVCPDNKTTSLSGIVKDPAGNNPIYHVLVYIPEEKPVTWTEAARAIRVAKPDHCDQCDDPDLISGKPITQTYTNYKGQFKLTDVPATGDFTLVIQIGRWRRQFTIANPPPSLKPKTPAPGKALGPVTPKPPAPGKAQLRPVTPKPPLKKEDVPLNTIKLKVAECANTPIPKDALTLPKNRREGDIPRIGLVGGSADQMECLLEKIGVSTDEYANPAAKRFMGEATSTNEFYPAADAPFHVVGGGLEPRIQYFVATGQRLIYPIKTVILTGPGGRRIETTETKETLNNPRLSLWNSTANLRRYDAILNACPGQVLDETTAGPLSRINVEDYLNHGGRVFTSHYGRYFADDKPTKPNDLGNLATWNDSKDLKDAPDSTMYLRIIRGANIRTKEIRELSKPENFYLWLKATKALKTPEVYIPRKGWEKQPDLLAANQMRSNIATLGPLATPWARVFSGNFLAGDVCPEALKREEAKRLAEKIRKTKTSRAQLTDAERVCPKKGEYYQINPQPPAIFTANTPINAPPDKVCGRLTYADFHVATRAEHASLNNVFPKACKGAELTPQEKALEFLLFDNWDCVAPEREVLPPPAEPAPPAPRPPRPPKPPRETKIFAPKAKADDFAANCPPGKRPEWRRFSWNTLTPVGTKIVIEVRASTTEAGLATATAIPLLTIPDPDQQNGELDMYMALQPYALEHAPWLRILYQPTTDNPSLTPIIRSPFVLDRTCVDGQ